MRNTALRVIRGFTNVKLGLNSTFTGPVLIAQSVSTLILVCVS